MWGPLGTDPYQSCTVQSIRWVTFCHFCQICVTFCQIGCLVFRYQHDHFFDKRAYGKGKKLSVISCLIWMFVQCCKFILFTYQELLKPRRASVATSVAQKHLGVGNHESPVRSRSPNHIQKVNLKYLSCFFGCTLFFYKSQYGLKFLALCNSSIFCKS